MDGYERGDLKCHPRHKTRCWIYFRTGSVVLSRIERPKLGRNRTNNSCRKRLENGDNRSVVDFGAATLKRETQEHVLLSGPPLAGSSVRPHGAFWEGQIFKLRFRVLPLNVQALNSAAGNIRRCSV